MRYRIAMALLLSLFVSAGAFAAGKTLELTVEAGKTDRHNTPVCVPLSVAKEFEKDKLAVVRFPDGKEEFAQFTAPGLLTEGIAAKKDEIRRDLHFLVPNVKAGDTLHVKVVVRPAEDGLPKGFSWHETKGEFIELTYGDRPVLRYVDAPFDDSTKEKREETFKVYHHLYDPTGKAIITKGPGGEYTHHRGLFYGFKATYESGGKKITADTWHCPPPSGDPKKPSLEAHMEHEKVLSSEAGVVLGRHRVQIGWFGAAKERFAVEERELTVYNTPGGLTVDFASKLTPVKGTVKVDGDPQHAGFHFRVSNDVSVAAKAKKSGTYFLRPDGKGEPDTERNWPADKKMADLPWNAMSFVIGDKRYTAAYLDRPTNPKEARYSERTYGRFGSYFVAECDEKKPLVVAYRLWLQEGEMTKEGIEAKSADFVTPPTVVVK